MDRLVEINRAIVVIYARTTGGNNYGTIKEEKYTKVQFYSCLRKHKSNEMGISFITRIYLIESFNASY